MLPSALRIAESLAQKTVLLTLIEVSGSANTVEVYPAVDAEQLLLVVTVAEYVPVVFEVILCVVSPVFHK
jgi:succinyl-CoA synthetase alpha subunit